MDNWAGQLIDDLHPYRTVPGYGGQGIGRRVGYGVSSSDAIGIAQAYQTKRVADALDKIGVLLAQVIETRSAKTEGLGPKDESAVGKADAPEDGRDNQPPSPIKGG